MSGVDHARLDVEARPAARRRARLVLLRAQHGRERRDLGLAVAVEGARLGQALAQLLEHRHRHDRGAVIQVHELAEIALVEVRMAQQRDPHGRRREERRDGVALDQLEHDVGLRRLDEHRRGADQQLGHREGVELRGMIERQCRQRLVLAAELEVVDAALVLARNARWVIAAPLGDAVVPDV